MTILALDQATKISGYSVWKDGQLINYGKWEHSDSDVAMRIYRLCQEIQSKIEEYDVSLVVLENIQLQKEVGGVQNVDTFHKLAWVQGAILLLCMQLNIPYKLMYPTEWRSVLNINNGNKYRAAKKDKDRLYVKEQYGLNLSSDDIADAICIGAAYLSQEEQNNIHNWE